MKELTGNRPNLHIWEIRIPRSLKSRKDWWEDIAVYIRIPKSLKSRNDWWEDVQYMWKQNINVTVHDLGKSMWTKFIWDWGTHSGIALNSGLVRYCAVAYVWFPMLRRHVANTSRGTKQYEYLWCCVADTCGFWRWERM